MALQKWLYKYKYLQAEFDELNDINESYITEFDSIFQLETSKTEADLKEELQESIEQDNNLPTGKSKDLYKQLSKHAHPDKGGSAEDFIEVKDLYRDDNVLGLISKAEEYDIDINELNIEFEEAELERSCIDLENKCNNIKTTLAWEWANADDETKDRLIIYYEKALGLKYIPNK